jgi:hypothetical protein
MMRLEVHSEAREEFLQAVSFYDAQVPGLGLRFIAEIERCQKELLETPLIGHPYGRRLRKFTVGDKFPYSIVYAVLARLYLYWHTLMARGARAIGGRGPSANSRFERSRDRVFGGPRRDLMIRINQLRLMSTQPRVAQPHR